MEIKLEIGDKWRLYCPILPVNAVGIGVLHMIRQGTTHALIRLSNGKLVRVNGSVIRSISKETRETIEALLIRPHPSKPGSRHRLRLV